MRPDVLELKNFYASPLGRMTARLIRTHIHGFWSDDSGKRVLAIGYGVPYLVGALGNAERAIALMPERQGAIVWPHDRPSLSLLGDEAALPFPDAMFDRLLMVHALEYGNHAGAVLKEAWRVLAPGGELLIITPNRRGLWTRFEATPFGNGRPFSRAQLSSLLSDSQLSPLAWSNALMAPPVERRTLIAAMPGIERVGGYIWRKFGGVHLVRAEKIIYAARPIRQPRRQPRFSPALARPPAC